MFHQKLSHQKYFATYIFLIYLTQFFFVIKIYSPFNKYRDNCLHVYTLQVFSELSPDVYQKILPTYIFFIKFPMRKIFVFQTISLLIDIYLSSYAINFAINFINGNLADFVCNHITPL